MILIFSFEFEVTTTKVVEWLVHCGVDVVVLNEWNRIRSIEYLQDGAELSIKVCTTSNVCFRIDEMSAVWYRRGQFHYREEKSSVNLQEFHDHDRKEWDILNEQLMEELRNKPMIADFLLGDVNKLKVLKLAAQIGLNIPKTLIADNRATVLKHFCNSRIINKTIDNVLHQEIDQQLFMNRTVEVFAQTLPVTFFPSKFQELIEKEYELRIFYLNGECFASAIFSQSNEKTVIDFRNYDYSKPNRTVPYKLPIELSNKLVKLMTSLNLNTGSIDIIVGKDGRFYFLEVNPVGQFGMVSAPCNYGLEQLVARTLLREDERSTANC